MWIWLIQDSIGKFSCINFIIFKCGSIRFKNYGFIITVIARIMDGFGILMMTPTKRYEF